MEDAVQAFNVGPQQQQPGNIFAWIDELHASVPPMTRWVLAVVGGIGGFCYANTHGAEDYTVLLVTLGFFGGLLLIQIVAFALKALVALIIVGAIGLIAYWLFTYQASHHQRTNPSPRTTVIHF
jgi:hypothetical protein